jgi:hypothetical protein
MADQTFMFMITAGTMVGLAVLLFVSKGRRARSARSIEKERTSPSSPSSPSPSAPSSPDNKKSYDNLGRKVKKYTSDGKPIYED